MNSSRRPRVLLADDHRMVTEGLKALLVPAFDLVGVVEDGRALLEAAERLQPDVIVADVSMPQLNGIDAVAKLKEHDKNVRVVILSMHQDVVYARRAIEAGALGYVLKHSAPDELVVAIGAALEGKTYVTPALAGALFKDMKREPDRAQDPVALLTPRQRQILQLFAEGRSAKEIGETLAISARTVEFHKYQMMETLGLYTNADLVRFAIKYGIVSI